MKGSVNESSNKKAAPKGSVLESVSSEPTRDEQDDGNIKSDGKIATDKESDRFVSDLNNEVDNEEEGTLKTQDKIFWKKWFVSEQILVSDRKLYTQNHVTWNKQDENYFTR